MKKLKPLQRQIAGSHYKDFPIQPLEFCQLNNLNFCESSIVKYACRWDKKGKPVEDLKKIIHFAEILIEMYESKTKTAPRKSGKRKFK